MFVIFTDSSSDLTKELRNKYKIEYFRMGIFVKDEEKYADISWEDYSPEQLYEWVSDLKNHCHTSIVRMEEFKDRMIPYLEKGIDILYLACSGHLSGTFNFFNIVKEELLGMYKDRKIIGIDTCRADMGLGLICIEAAKLRDKGQSMEEIVDWVEKNKQFYHQVGSLETLTYLKAAGRVKGAKAFFGNLIGIKPIIIMDVNGNNYAFKSAKGSKNALNECFEYIKENITEETDVIHVGQAMAQARQAWLKSKIEEELKIPVEEFWIGPIVGVSCGPGMYGCWFRGKEVTVDGENK